MVTATELLFSEEFRQLADVAEELGWVVIKRGPTALLLGVPARDKTMLWLHCTADRYPVEPPAWRWCGPEGIEPDAAHRCAVGGAFFHTNGVICAPWNRLAYRVEDERGPHGDWVLGDWKANSYTGQCTTLTAMAARIAIEAAIRYTGRKGKLDEVA